MYIVVQFRNSILSCRSGRVVVRMWVTSGKYKILPSQPHKVGLIITVKLMPEGTIEKDFIWLLRDRTIRFNMAMGCQEHCSDDEFWS